MQKALEQDSTVYDYDAVYDEIQKQRLEKTQKTLHGTDKRVILSLRSPSIAFGDECRRVPLNGHVSVCLNAVVCSILKPA